MELTGGSGLEARQGIASQRDRSWLQQGQAAFLRALTYHTPNVGLAGLEQGVLSWAIGELWRIGSAFSTEPPSQSCRVALDEGRSERDM